MSSLVNTAFMIAYPKDGTKKNNAIAGTYLFDFDNGKVTDPNQQTTDMSNNLKKLQKDFVKSVFIFVSTQDAIIKVGNTVLPQRQNLAWILNQFHFTQMSITFPSGRTPSSNFGFQVVASTEDIFPLNVNNLSQIFTIPTITGNCSASLATLFDILSSGFGQIVIATENTDATNSITLHVQYSEDGVNWFDYQGYPVTLAVGDTDNFAASVQHAYYRVYAVGVAGTPSYLISATLAM